MLADSFNLFLAACERCGVRNKIFRSYFRRVETMRQKESSFHEKGWRTLLGARREKPYPFVLRYEAIPSKWGRLACLTDDAGISIWNLFLFLPELGYGLPAPVREIQPSQPPDRSCFCNIEALPLLISGVLLAPIIVVTVEVKKRFELSNVLFTWHTGATKIFYIIYKRHSERNIHGRFYDERCWVGLTDNSHKNVVGEQCSKSDRVCWYSTWPKFEIFSRYSYNTESI